MKDRDSAAEAIETLVREHGDRLYAISRQLCRNESEAEDLVQETLLNAYRGWEHFEGRSKATTWLYTIAKRACIRRHRKRSGEPETIESLEELLPMGDRTVPDPTALESPLDKAVRRETRQRIEAGIAKLPLDFRLPVVLKDLAELTVAEIAAILDLPENTVKTRIHRARLKLRQAIASELPQIEKKADHSLSVCLDLLTAKQEALDRGAQFDYSDRELCSRCQSMFATLDLGQDVCMQLGNRRMPKRLKQLIDNELVNSEVSRPNE